MNLNVDIVKKEILLINIRKTVGPDEIHLRMLKELIVTVEFGLYKLLRSNERQKKKMKKMMIALVCTYIFLTEKYLKI